MLRQLRFRRAGVKIGQVVALMVIAGLAIPGFQIFQPWWRYWRMLHTLSGAVNEMKVNTAETIKKSVLDIAHEVGVPDEFDRNLKVYKDSGGPDGGQFVNIETYWTDEIRIFGQFPVTFQREIKKRKSLWK